MGKIVEDFTYNEPTTATDPTQLTDPPAVYAVPSGLEACARWWHVTGQATHTDKLMERVTGLKFIAVDRAVFCTKDTAESCALTAQTFATYGSHFTKLQWCSAPTVEPTDEPQSVAAYGVPSEAALAFAEKVQRACLLDVNLHDLLQHDVARLLDEYAMQEATKTVAAREAEIVAALEVERDSIIDNFVGMKIQEGLTRAIGIIRKK